MLVHIDDVLFIRKPQGYEIGGIKNRLADHASIKDVTTLQIAEHLLKGGTVQPAVTPFSEKSRQAGKTGTCDSDFASQIVYMDDIDNKRTDVPFETPQHVAEVLARDNLPVAFAYETFNSTKGLMKFRFALVSDEAFTDRKERDDVQKALIKAFPQSDPECVNADRIFFGTDKGLCEGIGNMNAVCKKADLLKFAERINGTANEETDPVSKFGEIIPVGVRHGTLLRFAEAVLTKHGECEKAYQLYIERTQQCEEPKGDEEIAKIWNDACKHYHNVICKQPGYVTPEQYAVQEFEEAPKKKRTVNCKMKLNT